MIHYDVYRQDYVILYHILFKIDYIFNKFGICPISKANYYFFNEKV